MLSTYGSGLPGFLPSFFALFVFVFDALSCKKNFFIFLVVAIVIVVVAFAVFVAADFRHFLCLPLAWSCQVTI